MNVGANRLSVADTIFSISYSFCINLGSLLDTGDKTLKHPDRHSVHCLIDVGQCVNSGFQLLSQNPDADSGEHVQLAEFDDAGHDMAVDLAKAVGSCTDCDNGRNSNFLSRGLQMTVIGTLVERDGDVPLLQVDEVFESSIGCEDMNMTASFEGEATTGNGNGDSAPGILKTYGSFSLLSGLGVLVASLLIS